MDQLKIFVPQETKFLGGSVEKFVPRGTKISSESVKKIRSRGTKFPSESVGNFFSPGNEMSVLIKANRDLTVMKTEKWRAF